MLVEERLAACGTLLPGATSIYRWQGAVEEAQEVQIILKTTTENVTKLIARVTEIHPYEVPEIICLQVADGLPAYLAWIDSSTI
jgi:periplasmic divalent cation tolerance protein